MPDLDVGPSPSSPDAGATKPEVNPAAVQHALLRAATTWSDRLLRPPATNQRAAAEVDPSLIERWRTAVDPHRTGAFERRLRWAGLNDPADVLCDLPVSVPEEVSWWADLLAIRRSYRDALGPDRADAKRWLTAADEELIDLAGVQAPTMAFAHVFLPPLRATAGAAFSTEQWPPAVRRTLAADLLRRWCRLAGRALYEGFCEVPTIADELVDSDRTRYAAFVHDVSIGGLAQLLLAFPVLGRLLAVARRQWLDAVTELSDRLQRDLPLLRQRFGVPSTAGRTSRSALTGIEWPLSDPHRGGRAVAVLHFGEQRLVYKPKDLGLEAAYNALLRDWARPAGLQLRALDVLPRSDAAGCYGYVEFAAYEPAHDLDRFFARAGQLLALLHLLGCSDGHNENLLVSGDDYLLVDPETMFEAPLRGAEAADEQPATSVLGLGILPRWRQAAATEAVEDVSALGHPGAEADATATGPGWIAANTDAMRWGLVDYPEPHPASLPTGPGEPTSPIRIDALTSGFRRAMSAMMGDRPRLHCQLDSMRGLTRRLVFRSTRTYVRLQRNATSAVALRSPIGRGLALEPLSRAFLLGEQAPPFWPLLQAELAACEDLDVPMFTHAVGSVEVLGDGPVTGRPGTAATPIHDGLAQAVHRLNLLDDAVVEEQLRLIRASVATVDARLDDTRPIPLPADRVCHPAPTSPGGSDEPARFAAASAELLGRIDAHLWAQARRQEDGWVWLDPQPLPDGRHLFLGSRTQGLVSGVAGTLPYLAVRSAAARAVSADDDGDDEQSRSAAEQLLAGALATHDRLLAPGEGPALARWLRSAGYGLNGLGGTLRSLWWLRSHATTPAGRESAALRVQQWLDHLYPSHIEAVTAVDVMDGLAGLIPTLAEMGEPGRPALSAATHRLLRLTDAPADAPAVPAVPAVPAATATLLRVGLGRGAAGVGWALIRGGSALGEQDLVTAGLAVLDGEDANLTHTPGAHGDARSGSWLAGTPGAALVRSELCRLLPRDSRVTRWKSMIAATADELAAAPPRTFDHLLCGNAGTAWPLLHWGRLWERPDWSASGERLLQHLIDAAAGGLPQLPGQASRDPRDLAPVGLLTGLTGVGLVLNRRADPAALLTLLL